MKKLFMILLITSQVVISGEIIGLYKCKSVLVEQFKNGSVSKKRMMFKSLHLNITKEKITVYGMESGRSICKDIEIDQVFRDTLFIIPRLEKNIRNRARLYFNKDTLAGDYNFLNNNSSDSVAVKMLISRVPLNFLDRLKRQCR